jgi:gliding motility-associated-like protein
MKRLLVLLLLNVCFFHVQSQCFQIQSILVDACAGSQEGQNEMVTFQVGSTALNTANMSVNWPNNNWLGLTKTSATAASVSSVNATIAGCGFLKEPVGGLLPANAKVLLVTSTAWSPMAQSFANLTDTFYIIFQTAGNTAGHFANYQSGGGLRTLSISFSSPSGCTDAVTYDRGLLVNQSLIIGAQDGAAVEFTAAGVATYINNGCQAPYSPFGVNAGPDKTACSGSSQNFTATVTGDYSLVSWSIGAGAAGSVVPTNSLSTTYFPGPGETGPVKLYSTIMKSCGTQTTTVKDSVMLYYVELPSPVISASTSSLCPGQTSVLSYSLTNAPLTGTNSVIWLPGNMNTPTISVNSPNVYSVSVGNVCGTAQASYTLGSLTSPSVTLSAPSLTACSGGTVSFSATSNTGNYQWNNPTSNSSSVVITAVSSTTGVVTTTNSCGSDYKTYTLTVISIPTISVNNSNVTLCSGQSFTVNAFSNTPTFTWQPGGSGTNSLVVNSAGSHTVTVSNACGSGSATLNVSIISAPTLSINSSAVTICPSGQTATLTAVGSSGSYSWSTGSNSSTTTITSPGVYSASVTVPGCGSAVANISLGAAPLPIVNIQVPAVSSVCAGGSIILTATSSEGNYLWPGGITTQTYSAFSSPVVVSSTNSCGTAQATQSLNFVSTPSVSLSASSTTLCTNQTITLQAISDPAYSYNWDNGANTSSVTVNSPGVKTVSVTNSCGQAVHSITISAASLPVLNLSASVYSICPGESATLTVTGGVEPYVWSNSSVTGSVVTSTGGVVSVSNTNYCGTTSQTIQIALINLNAHLVASPQSGTAPLVVNFVNLSSGATAYTWDFGNGNGSSSANAGPQTYLYPGVYMVYLNASNSFCSDIDSLMITVTDVGPTLYVPNAFTPNGDSINDVFKVGATQIKEFDIIIFDRWGLQLYSSSDINEGWNGYHNGKPVSDGTYFFLINAIGNDDKSIKKQGTVTLFK